MKPIVLAEPVLVGRKAELEELQRCLDSAIRGKGNTVFVSGEAGSGKTRLIKEFLDTVKKKNATVLVGWCMSDAQIPYFPFVEAFNSFFARFEDEYSVDLQGPKEPTGFTQAPYSKNVDRGITAWLSGPKDFEKFGRPETVTPQVWKDQVFAGVARTLHEISSQQPTILFLEDIHWADSASLALLHYLARSIRNTERTLIVAAFRSEELTANIEGHSHPLAETMRIMNREDLYKEIRLPILNHEEVSKIAENMIGGSLQPTFAQKIGADSQGNPLFVVESIRMLAERRSLYLENNQWRLTVDTLGIPDKFRDIIMRRLSLLSLSQRRALDAASVIGERFDVELLSDVLGQDSLEVLENLNSIARSTSLLRVEENTFRFDHAKSRSVIYAEIAVPLKRGYHKRVAEKLETASRDGGSPLGDIAYHYAESGSEEKAIDFALAAAQDALAKFSNTEAIKHFKYTIEKAVDTPRNAEKRRLALEGLGDAYYANGLFAKALEVFEHLADSETGALKLRAYRKAMDAIFFGTREWARLFEVVKKAEPYAASDRLESAKVRFLRGGAFVGSGNFEAGVKDFEEALQVFKEEFSLPDVARALTAIGITCAVSRSSGLYGQYQRVLSASLQSIAIHEELGDLRWLVDATTYGAITLFLYLVRSEAEKQLKKSLLISKTIGDYAKMTQANVTFSILYERLGRIEEALAKMLEAIKCSERTDAELGREVMYARLVRIYSKLGDLGHAEIYYSMISGLLSGNKPLPPNMATYAFISGSEALTIQAVFLAAKDRWKEAYQLFDEALEKAKTAVNFSAMASVKADYAWALARQGRIEEADILRQEAKKVLMEQISRFAHVNVNASLMALKDVMLGQEFEVRLDMVNVSENPGSLLKVEGLVPSMSEVVALPSNCSLDGGSVVLKETEIGGFQVMTMKLRLRVMEAGVFILDPTVLYIDDLGETRTCKPGKVTITVQRTLPEFETLPDRVPIGFSELDRLLLGGIPENFAVVLASPSIDEREILVKEFLETGAKAGETTFYVTSDPSNSKALAEKHPSNFFLIVCNPQADAMIQSSLNIFKLKGVENLTDIDIALTKAFRITDPSAPPRRRFCIDIISDVLLQHHAVTTRKWLSGLLPILKSKGFTTLAVINPDMHPREEVQAILGLFEGEIQISEKETTKGAEKNLRIRRLCNQKYLDNELIMTGKKTE